MISDFKYLIFSIFCINDIQIVIDAIRSIFKTELAEGKAEIRMETPIVYDYINPISGGRHLPKFCCWKSKIYPNQIFFISNYEDGLSNVCRAIQKHIKCSYLMCALSNGIDNPFFKFYSSDYSANERSILAYKEDKWVFYEKGVPLFVENMDYYKNRLIKNRLNNTIIKEYLLKLGVNVSSIDEEISNGFVFFRKKW